MGRNFGTITNKASSLDSFSSRTFSLLSLHRRHDYFFLRYSHNVFYAGSTALDESWIRSWNETFLLQLWKGKGNSHLVVNFPISHILFHPTRRKLGKTFEIPTSFIIFVSPKNVIEIPRGLHKNTTWPAQQVSTHSLINHRCPSLEAFSKTLLHETSLLWEFSLIPFHYSKNNVLSKRNSKWKGFSRIMLVIL